MNISQKPLSTSLHNLIELDNQMRTYGFAWKSIEQILVKAESEIAEIRETIADQESKQRFQEEVGDLLHVVIALLLFAECDIEQTIEHVYEKLQKRFYTLQAIAQKHGYSDLKNQPTTVLLQLWDEAKKSI